MIGENLKALEVAEEKAQQREEEYKKQIKQLSEKFKNAEARQVTDYGYSKHAFRCGGLNPQGTIERILF